MVAKEFADKGITDAFVVTGGAIAPFTNSLVKQGRIRLHYMLTEQSAGIAAEAFGHFDGKPCLLIVTSGPGVTNALTPVAAAWTNSTPLVVVSGQARSQDILQSETSKNRQIGNQHLDTKRIVSSIVKVFTEPLTNFSSESLVADLYSEATSGRKGPVWLSFPQDIQRKPFKLQPDASQKIAPIDNQEKKLAENIWGKLIKSDKPLLFLGNGARTDDSQLKVSKIAEVLDCAVVTTWTGLDLISFDDDRNCGRPGTISSSWCSNLVQQAADSVVVLGARLDLAQVGFQPNNFAPEAKVTRVDIDSEEFVRIPKRESFKNFIGDAAKVIDYLYEISLNYSNKNNSSWWKQISEYRELPAAGSYRANDEKISTYAVIDALCKLPAKYVVLGSSGTCIEMVLQSWKNIKGQRFMNSGGLGSMGFAIPASIGVSSKQAVKGSKILVIESDGSFSMNIQDLHTISKILHAEIKIVVLNSGGYKSISISQFKQGQTIHGANEQTGLSLPIIEDWVKAAGINFNLVTNSSQLSQSIEEFWNTPGTSLIEIQVSETEEALPRLNSKPDETGQMRTADFAELSPSIRD